ncbi:MAG: chemotaxis protein CheB [Clostridiales bacterium]|nr:chemotaxis protein CheB [Clostridiales bacterium]
MDPYVEFSRRTITLDREESEARVLAIASSIGGTNALDVILRGLPEYCVPTVIVQHMAAGLTKMLAEHLNSVSAMEVREASDGDMLRWGIALLAPADTHMRLRMKEGLMVECFAGKRIHGLMPAADVLFKSVAEIIKDKAIGVVLTGMGADGADGLLQMRRQGARTIAQDKESSVVYGMPKRAFGVGAAEYVLPLNLITQKIMALMYSFR